MTARPPCWARRSGTTAPDIDFVLGGDPNLPNGGLMERFTGLYIPILNVTFNGPAVTDSQFKTVEINRQYDGAADFPLYPLNLIADLNAVLGFLYVHTYPFDVSLHADPTSSPAYQGTHGDTSYSTSELKKPTGHPITPRSTSMKKVTETNTDEDSTGPSAVKDPQPSASASTPKSAKPAKLRSVVRDSLGAGPQHPGRSHRGEGDEPTTSGGGDDS